MSAPAWPSALKSKKELAEIYISGAYSNHPHRLASLTLTGDLSYTRDERLFTANASPVNGQTCHTYTATADFTLATAWTRYIEPKCPFNHVLGSLLATHDFALLHQPIEPWNMQMQRNTTPLVENIGTITRRLYTYSSGSGTWNLTTTDAATDLTLDYYPLISGGGHPVSGGYDVTAPTDIQLIAELDGTYAFFLTDYPLTWDTITRFPWDSTWSDESAEYSTAWTAFLAARNTADGAGHSGTSGLTLTFTNV